MKELINQLKEKAKVLTPILRIGKNGLTDAVLLEIKMHLKKRKLIKLKLLHAALETKDKKEFARDLAAATNSMIIDTTGFIIVLYKK